MSYIAPNSDIYILRNVPLDDTYEHTLYFANEAEQAAYFSAQAKFRLNAQSYQRLQRGKIRVGIIADDLYDCNYVMYRNTRYEHGTTTQIKKWFYAFIKSVEYINESVSEIEFEIDVMQTWNSDYTLQACFVEREHSVNDALYENTVPEGLEIGDYISGEMIPSGLSQGWKVLVIITGKENLTLAFLPQPADPVYCSGSMHMANFDFIDTNNVDSIQDLLQGLSFFNHQDVVAGIYMVPTNFAAIANQDPSTVGTHGELIRNGYIASIIMGYTNTRNGNYVVKNKKLLSYPYRFLGCTNMQGEDRIYKYEHMQDNDANNPAITFYVYGALGAEPSMTLVPLGYMIEKESGTSPGELLNFSQSISITNFPHCTYGTTDAGAKAVQAMMSLAMSGINEPTPTIRTQSKTDTTLRKNKKGEIIGTKNRTVDDKTETISGQTKPQYNVAESMMRTAYSSGVKSNVCNGSTLKAMDAFDFYFRHMHLREEYARMIDDYFDMYGYKTNKLKVPNTHSRPHWNYVKTGNCCITGSIPADDANKIIDIYNSGITFWKHANEVGNYALDNRPL